jgi:ketosteroid isomerase-like protein
MNLCKITTGIFLLFSLSYANLTTAQEKKVAPTSTELYNEIEAMDKEMFDAFNTQNMPKFQSLFSDDLEWFQDNGGLILYKTVFENFANTFKKDFKLTRQLVKGSLEVHPIKGYGAIEIGVHQFRHFENGKEEIGTFKFLMIWQKKDGQWKISRVVSYDH